MKHLFAAWLALWLPVIGLGCDVCGIFLGIQPHDRTTSFSLLWRYRHLEGSLPGSTLALPKHGSDNATLTGDTHYRELYQVAEFRGDIWWSQRFATLVSIPMVNNYRAVNGVIRNDVYGMGDPFILGRYLLVNTKCLTMDERTVHRVMLGAGAKFPLGAHATSYNGEQVEVDQQPGTGSLDLLGSAEYMVRRGKYGGSLSVIGRYNGTNDMEHRMGHGISTTTELFRRFDIGEVWKVMPSLGVYHELAGKDALSGDPVQGTGSSTLFTHVGVRVWWRSWGFSSTYQHAVARSLGEQMIPNKERVVVGLTYNLIRNKNRS
ncbi:MAG: hypothetical protein IPI81_16740 [Flavobacteriales bacterium]|nr:hypothetical protein [Flavobacteriales bacterium]MCC6939446.1 hypothetical protein [Flavobacteriales bacterium]